MPIFAELRSLRVAPIALCILITACGQEKAPKKGPVEVGVVTLAAQNVTVSSELPARTVSTMQSEVRPQITGVIQKRLFTEGSMVTAGQPLYQIDERLYRASRDEAQAALVSAQATAVAAQAKAQRYRGLGDTEAVSAQDRDDVIATARQAAAAVGQARASLDTANVNLTFTQVRAPISGRIGRTLFTPGALVTASQTDPLTTIQQLDPIYVDVTQSSSQLLQLRRSLAAGKTLPASATIRLKLDDGSEYPLEGRIEFAEPIVDVDSGTVTLRARFPNPDGMLLPGMYVRVTVGQGVDPAAILVPQRAVQRSTDGQAHVLVVDGQDTLQMRPVQTAAMHGAQWQISAGLKAGERVVVGRMAGLQPGARVQVTALSDAAASPTAGLSGTFSASGSSATSSD